MKDTIKITDDNYSIMDSAIDPARHRFPFCIVWTPIPLLTYVYEN